MSRILLVEDDPDLQLLVSHVLAQFGHESVSAPSLSEARSLLKKDRFAMILLDVMLPDGDGVELWEELKRNPETRHMPVLFLTGRSAADFELAVVLKAEDYLQKPFSIHDLRAKIEKCLARSVTESPYRKDLR